MTDAIDEVENDRVPALVLVCRNSTDTSYFQVSKELWRNSAPLTELTVTVTCTVIN